MLEKSNLNANTGVFTANNISGSVNMRNLTASSSTYTYSGINKTGSTITSISVTLRYNKQTGKSESVICDVYSNYAAYQADRSHNAYLGTTTQTLRKGNNTAQFNMTLSGNNQIEENEEFIILFSSAPTSGTFSGITIEFNP